MDKLLRLVLRQTTRSMVRLQRQLHLNHTVKRAAMSGDIFLDNEHLDYNTFQTKWATASSPPSSSTTPPPVTTASSDGNRPLNAYELQSMFYGDFLPTFLEENPSLLHDWSYEKGAPPPNEIFDQIILEFYAKHLPNQTISLNSCCKTSWYSKFLSCSPSISRAAHARPVYRHFPRSSNIASLSGSVATP